MNDQNTIDMAQPEPKPQRAVAKREPRAVAVAAAPTTPMDLLRLVTERGASVEEIGKFMDLMERQQANEARQAFVRAMAAFKRNPPDIYKDKDVGYEGKNGVAKTSYSHATLGNICEKVIAALAEHGISHNWSTAQTDGRVKVTCTLTHDQGHSERVTLEAAPDTSGSKNSIQAIGSAITYLSRYTLLAACGIAVKDASDDDGASIGLDTSLADEWIAKVKAAPTDADVVKVWEVGIAAIEKAKDQHAYKEFKQAVAERRADLASKGGAA